MGIVDDDVARVREVTDIVALVGEHVGLKRVGRRFQGLCPFHTEKSPSFSVNPEMGVYFCFGCQKSGDAITFVREVEHLDFVEAVERLAARAGVTLRYDDANFSAERKRKQRLHDAVGAAIDFYHHRLLESDDAGNARRYLRSRGFDGDHARRFSLGFSPDGYDMLSVHLQNKKFARQDCVDAGLSFVNRAQKLQDQFRGRLMFPIWDARGEPVGFGGRLLEGTGSKYKNSPETPLYQKSRLLYGLHWAKGEIVARGEVVICEGYTDVMAFALAGVPVAVATCGTALADEHFLTLKNLARKVTLAYDADAAGQAAAERCYQWEQRYEVQFQVADLPEGRDPADVWRDDPEALVSAVKAATPFLEFRIDRLLAGADLSSLEGRAHAAERAATLVAEHPSDLVRDQYVMKLAGHLDITPDRLRDTVARAHARPHIQSASQSATPSAPQLRPVDRRELDALRWAVLAPDLMSGRLDVALFADPVARSAFEALTTLPWHECLAHAPPEAAALLKRLAVEEPSGTNAPEEIVARVVVNLVEASSLRLLASMLRTADERSAAVKALLDALVRERTDERWLAGESIAEQLVGWITDGGDRTAERSGPPDA
ncbi:MAG: DNA primase [Actinomycetota bacterium]